MGHPAGGAVRRLALALDDMLRQTIPSASPSRRPSVHPISGILPALSHDYSIGSSQGRLDHSVVETSDRAIYPEKFSALFGPPSEQVHRRQPLISGP